MPNHRVENPGGLWRKSGWYFPGGVVRLHVGDPTCRSTVLSVSGTGSRPAARGGRPWTRPGLARGSKRCDATGAKESDAGARVNTRGNETTRGNGLENGESDHNLQGRPTRSPEEPHAKPDDLRGARPSAERFSAVHHHLLAGETRALDRLTTSSSWCIERASPGARVSQ